MAEENKKNNIILFQNKSIRRVWHEEEWFYSVIDVVGILAESKDAKDYWYRLKKCEEENGIELSTNCRRFKLTATDGKKRLTDCANTQGMLRIIQSIPSSGDRLSNPPISLLTACKGFTLCNPGGVKITAL